MTTPRIAVLALAALVAAAPSARAGIPRPNLDFTLGTTFAADGKPAGGGVSAAFSPMWDVTDHARFGPTVFADDIGTSLVPLYDRNNGTSLGTIAETHRMTWGLAWRCDVDALRRGRWNLDGSATLGVWRVQDDVTGNAFNGASGIGWTLGALALRDLGHGRDLGLALRFHRIFPERNAAYDRVGRYATAALEWRWSAPETR